jgi:hypothetical protein
VVDVADSEGVIEENTEGAPKGKPRWGKGSKHSAETRAKISARSREAHARRRGEASGDKPPKAKRTRGPVADRKAEDLRLIREWAGAVLAAPAMLGAATSDPWLVDHFTTRGPALADALVKEAERNERMRAMLVNLATAAGPAALLLQAGLYIALPLMHFGVLPGAPLLGVPVVRQAAPARPVPGAQPPFVAPERGPATAPTPAAVPEGFASWEEWAAAEGIPTIDDDELAAELAAHENGGGMMPPLPIEPV